MDEWFIKETYERLEMGADADRVIDDLLKKVEQSQTEADTLRARVAELEAELECVTVVMNRYRKDWKAADSEVGNLEAELEELRNERTRP